MKERLLAQSAKIIEKFEEETRITGLDFKFVERKDYNGHSTYYMVADVPDGQLGIMANNMKNVQIAINMLVSARREDTIILLAKFHYGHRDGGNNGCDVMVPGMGGQRFYAELLFS